MLEPELERGKIIEGVSRIILTIVSAEQILDKNRSRDNNYVARNSSFKIS